MTVFVTTHYMDEAEYCERIALIYRGELIAGGSPEELKTRFMQEDVLEIVCNRPQDALPVIQGLNGVKEVALFGKSLHVVAEDGAAATRLLEERLPSKGFGIARLEKVVPSMEDIFVSLIEARDRAARPVREVER